MSIFFVNEDEQVIIIIFDVVHDLHNVHYVGPDRGARTGANRDKPANYRAATSATASGSRH
jgi:hypothetical protein